MSRRCPKHIGVHVETPKTCIICLERENKRLRGELVQANERIASLEKVARAAVAKANVKPLETQAYHEGSPFIVGKDCMCPLCTTARTSEEHK